VSGNFDDERPRWPEGDLYGEQARRPEPEPQPEPEPEPEPEPQPEQDFTAPAPVTEASEPTTSLGDATTDPPDPDGWDSRRDGDRRRPTTAEQAVPWLIGAVLALSGIVVVLLALIFVGPEGVAVVSTPSPSASAAAPSVSETPIASATPLPTEGPTPIPPPVFGALEMTFLGRATAASPIRLSRRDFSTTADPTVVLEDAASVAHYTWAPDGRIGAAIVAGRAVALVEGQAPRTLTDPVDALIFAADSTTLYGLRITTDGGNDRAEALSINFDTGATEILATITYPHPQIIADPALKEAQFADDGGIARLYVTVDDFLVAWILGAPATYRIDPVGGSFTQVDNKPVLWSPNQLTRIDLAVSGTATKPVTTLTLIDHDEIAQASVKVSGLVSHIRWADSNNEIVFTLGRTISGGVHQDLYVWDLVPDKAPAALTSNGASFGAEWLSVLQTWMP
jgi:hypothetical protein